MSQGAGTHHAHRLNLRSLSGETHFLFTEGATIDSKASRAWSIHIPDKTFEECKHIFVSSVPSKSIRYHRFKQIIIRNLHYRIDDSYKVVVQKLNALSHAENDSEMGCLKLIFDVQKLPYSAFPCTSNPDDEFYVDRTNIKMFNGKVSVQFDSKLYNDDNPGIMNDNERYNTIRVVHRGKLDPQEENELKRLMSCTRDRIKELAPHCVGNK